MSESAVPVRTRRPRPSAQDEDLAGLFRALGDETRLRIFLLLTRGEFCVCEIEDMLGLSQSKVSNHLSVLRRLGLALSRRDDEDGRWIFYRADPRTTAALSERIQALLEVQDVPGDPRRAQLVCRLRGR